MRCGGIGLEFTSEAGSSVRARGVFRSRRGRLSCGSCTIISTRKASSPNCAGTDKSDVRPSRSALRIHGLAQRHRQAVIMYAEAANHGTTLEVHVGAYVLRDSLRAPNITPSPR